MDEHRLNRQAFLAAHFSVALPLYRVHSGSGRKTAGFYFVFILGLDWRWGAFHFEDVLLDYDVAMNYGNWVVVAEAGALDGWHLSSCPQNRSVNMFETGGQAESWGSRFHFTGRPRCLDAR